jgi:hypothetical protein
MSITPPCCDVRQVLRRPIYSLLIFRFILINLVQNHPEPKPSFNRPPYVQVRLLK